MCKSGRSHSTHLYRWVWQQERSIMEWYVMVESYELGEESYTREEFKTFEEAQQFFQKSEGAWKPQRI